MKNNPMYPTKPIKPTWQRALEKAQASPRCGSKTRKGSPCQSPAMANGRCRMHGGKSTGAPQGNQNAFKHGCYTAEALERKAMLNMLLKEAKELLATPH